MPLLQLLSFLNRSSCIWTISSASVYSLTVYRPDYWSGKTIRLENLFKCISHTTTTATTAAGITTQTHWGEPISERGLWTIRPACFELRFPLATNLPLIWWPRREPANEKHHFTFSNILAATRGTTRAPLLSTMLRLLFEPCGLAITHPAEPWVERHHETPFQYPPNLHPHRIQTYREKLTCHQCEIRPGQPISSKVGVFFLPNGNRSGMRGVKAPRPPPLASVAHRLTAAVLPYPFHPYENYEDATLNRTNIYINVRVTGEALDGGVPMAECLQCPDKNA